MLVQVVCVPFTGKAVQYMPNTRGQWRAEEHKTPAQHPLHPNIGMREDPNLFSHWPYFWKLLNSKVKPIPEHGVGEGESWIWTSPLLWDFTSSQPVEVLA